MKRKNNNMFYMFYAIIVISLIVLGLYLYFQQKENTNSLVGKWFAKPKGVDTIFEFQVDKRGVLIQGNEKIPFNYEVTNKSGTATIDSKKYKFLRAELDVFEDKKKSHTPLLKVNIEEDDYTYIYTLI